MSFKGWPPRPTLQQGYFSYPQDYYPPANATNIDSSTPAAAPEEASCDDSVPTYTYYVRMINPKKKSDFLVRTWHDETTQFKSPAELKLKLIDSFPNEVPSTSNFQVGYFEPPGNSAKRWIMEKRDLSKMYKSFGDSSKINLWCDRKLQDDDENEDPVPKKKKKVIDIEHVQEHIDDIFQNLKKKTPKMEGPKLRLRAKLIQSGRHESYETPPPIPLITGGTSAPKPKKDSLTEAFAGAASAIANVLQPKSRSASEVISDSTKISPLKVASLRRSCLEDLKQLKDLLEDGVLTETEFTYEKQQILSTLKKISS